MDLIDAGVINGSRKKIDRGKHVIGMALGSERMLDWLAVNRKAADIFQECELYT